MPEEASPLEQLNKEELIHRLEDLSEELRMSRAFTNISETGSNDAILHWQGRNRFLAEKINPVRLEPVLPESYQPSLGNHRIIDGDNLSVMVSLLCEFRGGTNRGVDIIYLDPPYNTGEDVFSYNDDYGLSKSKVSALRRRYGRAESLVSLDDPSRHTKWINHMAPRLWAARKLLKNTGVIIISIDEHELPRLWMLMEEMFGEKNRIATMVWERSRKNDASYISEGHEYILVWARNKDALDAKRSSMATTQEWKRVKGKWRKRKDGADSILTAYAEAKVMHGQDVSKIQSALDTFFKSLPVDHPARKSKFKKANLEGVYRDDGDLSKPEGIGKRYDILHPITQKPCKIPSRGWLYPDPADMEALAAKGRINFGKDHNKIPSLISYLHEQETEVRTSIMYHYGQKSLQMIESILGKGTFNNPKDHEMLAELFNLVSWRNPEAIILDAYAGSGTTGQAVIEMNAEDGGRRRFILIESGDPSTKSKVARERYTADITAERVRRVLTGQWADGKEHPVHKDGFTFYRAHKEIDKAAIMASTRESLADIILQVVEDDSNRIDCRVDGHTYLIGKTRLGYGIALVWEPANNKDQQLLTWPILEKILDEVEEAKLSKPVHIYATGNTAAVSDDLYRFHQIPDAILARLNLLPGDEETE